MDQSSTNPPENTLGPGVPESKVLDAVRRSGYPLQTIVASRLRGDYLVQEEWAFEDRTTRETRAIDVLAATQLESLPSHESRVRPAIALLLECKQSDLPFVFFRSEPQLAPQFPLVAGLHKEDLVIRTDDDRSSWSYRTLRALGLDRHPFIVSVEHSCSTFSKCVRKGDELTLSGAEPYNSLVMPLVSAMEHYVAAAKPPPSAFWFDAQLTVAIGVLDAPMVIVELTDDGQVARLAPWIRLYRHDVEQESDPQRELGRLVAIDIVHRHFLATYLEQHLKPFAARFAELALKHHEELATGEGFVPGMGAGGWREIESRLRPRTVSFGPPARIPASRLGRVRLLGRAWFATALRKSRVVASLLRDEE